MGKIAKVLLVLIVLISILMPSVAMRIRGRYFHHLDTIEYLENTLADTRAELADTQQKLADTEQQLADTRAELDRTKRDLASARADIARLERELRTEKENRARVEGELRTRTQELAAARDEIRRKDSEINTLRGRVSTLEREKTELEETLAERDEDIETLKKIAGIADLDVEDIPLAEGRVISVSDGMITASFRGNLGILPWSNIFVSRRGRIVERVQLRQLHSTNVLFRFPAGDVAGVRQGDFVVMEEDRNVLVPELFKGVIAQFSRQGFATVELSPESFVSDIPKIAVYRGDDMVFEGVPLSIAGVVTVAELRIEEGSRIIRSDVVTIGK